MKKRNDIIVFENLYQTAIESLLQLHIADGIAAMTEICAVFPLLHDNLLQVSDLINQHQSLLEEYLNGERTEDCLKKQKQLSALALRFIYCMHRAVRVKYQVGCYGTVASDNASVFDGYRMGRFFSKINNINELKQTDAVLNFLWTMPILTHEDAAELRTTAAATSHDWQRMILAGLYLSLTEYFDYEKYLLLLEYATSDEMDLRVDATVYLLLVRQMHPRCLALYPDAPELPHDETTLIHLKEAQRAMIVEAASSRYVDYINKRIKKAANKEQGVVQVITQMAHLPIPTQIDLNLKNMAAIYSDPHFSHLSMWWIPYRANHPLAQHSTQSDMGENEVIRTVFSDPDRFALSFNDLSKQKDARLSDATVLQRILAAEYASLTDRYSIRMQNLYRFYSFSPWKNECKGIEELDFYLAGQKDAASYYPDSERLLIHKTLTAMRAYTEALRVADDLKSRQGCDAELLRSIGLCHQKTGNHEVALQAYTQAFLMDEEDLWTLVRIQECNEKLNRHAALVDCLQRRMRLDAAHEIEITASLAHVYRQLEQYEEALSCYYKLYYKDNGSATASNGILFCLFMLHNYEKARMELNRIAEHTVGLTEYEYLMAGHIEWAEGHFRKAAENYRFFGSISKCGRKNKKNLSPRKVLEECEPLLAKHGIGHDQFVLMMDCLDLP
ncbi:MAG: tetratricopeptide repeat protein [Bacteroidaceae bacterium]